MHNVSIIQDISQVSGGYEEGRGHLELDAWNLLIGIALALGANGNKEKKMAGPWNPRTSFCFFSSGGQKYWPCWCTRAHSKAFSSSSSSSFPPSFTIGIGFFFSYPKYPGSC